MRTANRKLKQQKVVTTTGRSRGAVYFFGFGLIGLVVLNVFFTVQTVVDGTRIAELEAQIAEVEAENRKLEAVVVRKSSLTEVINKVENTDFVEPTEVVYIGKDKPLAQLR